MMQPTLGVTKAILVFYYLMTITALIFNSLEIHLIRKKWHTVTYFEIILLNLAAADILTGLNSLVTSAFFTYYYAANMPANATFITVIYLILIFAVISSTTFVVIIGIERLTSVKMPLKHRIWHSSKRKIVKYLVGTWVVILLANVAVILDLRFRSKASALLASTEQKIIVGVYLLLGVFLSVIIYTWIAYLLLKRRSKFLKFEGGDQGGRLSLEVKKEKASVAVCALLVASFLIFNTPLAVGLFNGRGSSVHCLVVLGNSVVNPLIYFFKTYAEKYLRDRKVDAVSKTSEIGADSTQL